MIPEIGRKEVSKCSQTFDSLEQMAKKVVGTGADTVLIISPHGPIFKDAVGVSLVDPLRGDFGEFGASDIGFELGNDIGLAQQILKHAEKADIPIARLEGSLAARAGADRLDHGVMVPLYFLEKAGFKGKLALVTIGMLPLEELYTLGTCIKDSIDEIKNGVAVIASGDLSHRLTPDAPAGYSQLGKKFDLELMERLRLMDVEGIVSMDRSLIENAGECGLRPIVIMLGVLDGLDVKTDVLSYEGPFGVGYSVCIFEPGSPREERQVARKLFESRKAKMEARRKSESSLVRLARQALETYVREGKIIHAPQPLPEEMRGRAGVFVSLKKHGELRGCIGTTGPTRDTLADEIIHNAINAGVNDPRFMEVEPGELEDLTYSVDVLTPAAKINSLDELDPKRYGIIVKKGSRTGLLLPDLEGVDTVDRQISIAKQKAGIGPRETAVEIYKFEVVRHT